MSATESTFAEEEHEGNVLEIVAKQLEQRGKAAEQRAAQIRKVNLASDSSAVERLRALGYAGGEDEKK
jgi:hypothetical protein